MSRLRNRGIAAATASALVAVIAWGLPAAGNQLATNVSTGTPVRPAAAAPLSITLVTGDKVIASRGPGGTFSTEVHPGPGRAGMAFHKVALGNQQSVVPLDAVPLIASGVVDPRLFDVALLADLGLDDASAPRLPLLVQYDGQARAVRSALPEGTEVKRELPLVDAVAIGQERSQAGDLWLNWLNSPQAQRRTGLAGTVKKVWLDGGIKPNLDRSVPQIGAPAAWAIGATGKGVKVAILDSGYDATHPDLKGRVIATKGFTEDDTAVVGDVDGDVVDRIGHGTHVASTVAGSGAASGGRYRGVAPDADLLIGKICGDRNCETSDIIEGMEWAASEGARVANLSIGGGPTDGTDIIAQAVNKLTASSGTLFVASAGNFGAESTVGSPASADAALAVASVTKSDTLSTFSSRGPRLGDLAVKPDIAAPGDRIVAARAAGTPLDPVAINPSYAELSGTSMAAPHVTGAAALLAQLHPTWKAAELKSALMGSAFDLEGIGVFAQGAGRVDVGRAIKQPVTAYPSSLNLGLQSYPHTDDKPITKQVTYRNDGPTPVMLSLDVQASRIFKLSRTSLRVPAHGSATVDVTADTSHTAEGPHGGWLIAVGNGRTIRTTIGVGVEVASYEQKIEMLDRSGKPVVNDDANVGAAYLLDVDHQQLYLVGAGDTVRLPRGRYLVDAFDAKFNPGGQGFGDVTYFGEPDLIVDHAGSIVLDGRKAHQVAIKAPVTDAAPAAGGIGFARPVGDLTYIGGVGVNNSFEPGFSPALYVVPNQTGSAKDFTGFAHLAWAGMPDGQSPDGDFYLDSPYLYHDVAVWPGRFPAKPSLITKPGDYAHLDASYAGEPGTRANNYGYPTLPKPDAGGYWVGLFLFTPAVEMNLPFHRDEYYSAKGVSWAFETEVWRRLPNQDIEYTALVDSQHLAFPAGRSTGIRWQQGVFGPSLPDARGGLPGRDRQPWTSRDGDSLTVVVPMYADGGAGRFGDALVDSEHTTVSRDGVEIGSSDSPKQQTFALPAGDSAYVLKKEVKRSAERYKLSTELTSEWTFRSRRTPDGVATPLPLMTVRYSPALDDRNRAAAGRFEVPFSVERQYGAPDRPVVSAATEVSFDGKTWRPAPVRRTSRGWIAMIDQPGSGLVSLRTTAKDAVGNQVRQTILNAYELR
ncbi:MAG: hypothetical protein QOI21_2750 [Actinomycetota bacterium]|nr:hypothetical protein [Actinomycetota bacterium]